MPRTTTGPRFFAVKAWRQWLPKVDGFHHVELCLYLLLASSADEAATRGWATASNQDGHETFLHGARVTIHGLGVDQVYDTERDSLDDFVDDPLVFSHLYPVVDGDWIDFYDPARLLRPDISSTDYKGYGDHRLPDSHGSLEGDEERWFGVKVWRTWTVGDDDDHFEEVVLAVRGRSPEDARRRATDIAVRADTDQVNDRGEVVHVRTVNVDYVTDNHSASLVSRIGTEMFGQLFALNPDGTVEWFDPDNDLPFREGALG